MRPNLNLCTIRPSLPTSREPSVVPPRSTSSVIRPVTFGDSFDAPSPLDWARGMAGEFSGMRDSLLAEVDGASELDDVERLIREGAYDVRPDGVPPSLDAASLYGSSRLPDSLLGEEGKGLLVSSHTSKVKTKSTTKKPKKKHSFLAKLGATLGASVLFAAFDYVGYNLSKKNPTTLKLYRAAQVTAQGLLTYGLTKKFGWKTGAAFNAIWWTFGDDLLYYGIAEAMGRLNIVKKGSSWDRSPAFKGVVEDKVTWAWWTPVGLLRGGKNDKSIEGKTLFIQSGVGLAVALGLLAWK